MGRGRDLTSEERVIVHSKIKHHWDFEQKKIKHGGVLKIRALCDKAGVPLLWYHCQENRRGNECSRGAV